MVYEYGVPHVSIIRDGSSFPISKWPHILWDQQTIVELITN